jgi:hypothetical protein
MEEGSEKEAGLEGRVSHQAPAPSTKNPAPPPGRCTKSLNNQLPKTKVPPARASFPAMDGISLMVLIDGTGISTANP